MATFIINSYDAIGCKLNHDEVALMQKLIPSCILTLYQDGKYELDTIESSGSWERNGNKFSLIADAGSPVFSKLDLESHAQYKGAKYLILEMIGAVPSSVGFEGWFEISSSWYQNLYYVKE